MKMNRTRSSGAAAVQNSTGAMPATTHETRGCHPTGSRSSKRSLRLESTTTLLFETRKTSRYSGGNSNGYELTGTLSEAQDERDGGRVGARNRRP
jgi:hypothetical protein